MGEKYLKASEFNKGEYNAYKHGLRVLTGHSSFQVASNPQDPFFVLGDSKDSLSFLELENDTAEGKTVVEVTKHFNLKRVLYTCI